MSQSTDRQINQLEQRIATMESADFEALALDVFDYQFRGNPLYGSYCSSLGKKPGMIQKLEDIPYLPIGFFKSETVCTGTFQPEIIFESSGTTGSIPSRHAIKSLAFYEHSFLQGFRKFYGSPQEYCILGLLPSYLERGQSSLVYMTKRLMETSAHPNGGFYLHDFEKLASTLLHNENNGIKTLLLGVTYALLDFSEQFSFPLKHTIIMETGGMKGRRKEMLREEVHALLQERFHLDEIHSEYGMTELLSQAYSKVGGRYQCADSLEILIRAEDNPLEVSSSRELDQPIRGAINIIDLSNLYSCSFIATDDAGVLYTDGSFEVRGRLDHTDLRGCSLMTAD
jgi:hypothetical protein